MKYLHEEPSINEVVGSIIAIMAVAAIVYLAVDGNAAAQTALVSVAGAAAGTYYASNKNGNGNGNGLPKGGSGAASLPSPTPVTPTPPAPKA